jgi:hypothetical protein
MSEPIGAAGKVKEGGELEFISLLTAKYAKIAKEYVALALRPLRSLRCSIT